MTNNELVQLVKCLARKVKLLEENISTIYDDLSMNHHIDIIPVSASEEDFYDDARLEEFIESNL